MDDTDLMTARQRRQTRPTTQTEVGRSTNKRGNTMTKTLTLALVSIITLIGGCLSTGPDVKAGTPLEGEGADEHEHEHEHAGDDDDSAAHEHDGYAADDHEHEGFDWTLDCDAWESGPILLTAGNYSLEYGVVCHNRTRLDEAEADIDVQRDDIEANSTSIAAHTHPVTLPASTGSVTSAAVTWAGDCEIEDVGGTASPLPPILYSHPAGGDLWIGGAAERWSTVLATSTGSGCPTVSCADTWGDGGTLEDGDLWRSRFPPCVFVQGAGVALHRSGGWTASSPQGGYAWEQAAFVGTATTVTTEVAQ